MNMNERLIAAYIAEHEVFELAVHADPTALCDWAAKHMAANRYSSKLETLVEQMFKQANWENVKSELMLLKVKKTAP